MNHMNLVGLSGGLPELAATGALADCLRELELVARRRAVSATVNSRLAVEDGEPTPIIDSRQSTNSAMMNQRPTIHLILRFRAFA